MDPVGDMAISGDVTVCGGSFALYGPRGRSANLALALVYLSYLIDYFCDKNWFWRLAWLVQITKSSKL